MARAVVPGVETCQGQDAPEAGVADDEQALWPVVIKKTFEEVGLFKSDAAGTCIDAIAIE